VFIFGRSGIRSIRRTSHLLSAGGYSGLNGGLGFSPKPLEIDRTGRFFVCAYAKKGDEHEVVTLSRRKMAPFKAKGVASSPAQRLRLLRFNIFARWAF
jgi:hypothetical protein